MLQQDLVLVLLKRRSDEHVNFFCFYSSYILSELYNLYQHAADITRLRIVNECSHRRGQFRADFLVFRNAISVEILPDINFGIILHLLRRDVYRNWKMM